MIFDQREAQQGYGWWPTQLLSILYVVATREHAEMLHLPLQNYVQITANQNLLGPPDFR
jgi:hypothetical protein